MTVNKRCGNCNYWSRKGSHGTGWCSKMGDHRDARLKNRSKELGGCWEGPRSPNSEGSSP